MTDQLFIGLVNDRVKCYITDDTEVLAVPTDITLILVDSEYLHVGVRGIQQYQVSMSRVVDLAGSAYTGGTYTAQFLALVNTLYAL